MRKKLTILVMAALFLVGLAIPAFAGTEGSPDIYVNGKLIQSDVPAYIKNARTMVPIRFIAEAFGFKVNWAGMNAVHPVQIYPVLPGVNDQAKGVADDYGFFALKPGDTTILFIPRRTESAGRKVFTGQLSEQNAEILTSDVAPEIKDGRTFVPLRVLAEAFGCRVSWDGDTYTVTVGPPDESVLANRSPYVGPFYRQDIVLADLAVRSIDENTIKTGPVDLVAVCGVVPFVVTGGRSGTMLSDVPVAFYVDGKMAGTVEQKAVFADSGWWEADSPLMSWGASAKLPVYLAPGTHKVKTVVDPGEIFFDRDRSNNTKEITITIK
ncbi:hypothetical membrane protein [Pelotomaculum thermopropionicum SI]|uniref:Hypothetical membrane protein n=1 Tax=Pelotomaculum thermopropionicum (strain DSM 13744 / JCM 10971 / SI) TaxID=370438 RepID=A5CZA8_PELTS|nr:hypothetical membrane protein [Pelotomaculum thermopropionicum SI]